MAKKVRDSLANDPTTRWCEDVVAGRIISGELGIYAAERHLRDLRDGPARGLHWRPEKAMRAIGFFPAVLSITAGAMVGKPFELLPWHKFMVGQIFGWHRASGRLRFRSVWAETGKGQAKSPLMAGVGLYMLGYHGVQRAEAYAIGQDRKTANVLFQDAVAMCRAQIPGDDPDDNLVERGEVIIRGDGDNAWKIEHPDTGSKFQALANGDAISGPRPVYVAADEIHEFKTVTSIETWQEAIAKMPGDAFMFLGTNTPSTAQKVGTDLSEFYQKVLKGDIRDDEALAFIARVDKADRETVFDNPGCWAKALPALGITFPVENVAGRVETAKARMSTAMSVKRLYFGIPIGSVDFWIDEEAWVAVQGKVDPKEFIGCPCWAAIDLSKKNDLTALTVIWLKGGKHYSKTWYWTTRPGLEDRARTEGVKYEEWAEDPAVAFVALDFPTVEKSFVAAQLAEIAAVHDLQALAFDPAGMADFEQACVNIGFPVWRYKGPAGEVGVGLKMISHAQGTMVRFEDKQLCMPRSVERLEDGILEREIVIDSCPVTYMCAGNAKIVADGQNNRAFDKKNSRGRIDGLVTNAMAYGAATYNAEAAGDTLPEDFEIKVWG